MSEAPTPKLSIVTTIFHSENYLERFLTQLYQALVEIECDSFEVIFVNDGSPDDSLQLLLGLKQSYPEIVILELSRNFGHHHAALAGLGYSRGELVFIIDCDLEVSPLVLKDFHQRKLESSADVIYGYQTQRKGNWFEQFSGSLYWRLFNALSDTNVPPDLTTARIMTREYVDAVVKLGDRNLFLAGMYHWVGFEQEGIPISTTAREGKSTYSLPKKIKLFVNSITSFSAYPLQLIFYLGMSITAFSFLLALLLIIQRLLLPEMLLTGWTSLAVFMSLSLGIVTTCIGVIGIYLSRVYSQTQNRPLYYIKNIY
ncbi:MAG: glycosyltransferase family 2 protein [Bdellovibrionales bacterium]|nr:glycosyltransferase family 2 protein [Bdellovibrionales bacterium]